MQSHCSKLRGQVSCARSTRRTRSLPWSSTTCRSSRCSPRQLLLFHEHRQLEHLYLSIMCKQLSERLAGPDRFSADRVPLFLWLSWTSSRCCSELLKYVFRFPLTSVSRRKYKTKRYVS